MYWMMVPQGGGYEAASGRWDEGCSEMVLEVGRTRWALMCAEIGGEGFLTAEGFSVAAGSGYPALRSCCMTLDANGEDCEVNLRLRKDYATVYIYLKDLYSTDLNYEISGEVCGMGVDGKPIKGEFRCPLLPQENALCAVRVPRQGSSDALRLNIISDTDPQGRSQRTLARSFALGEMVLAAGYDWTEDDLRDFGIEVDYSRTNVAIGVDQWRRTLDFDLTL